MGNGDDQDLLGVDEIDQGVSEQPDQPFANPRPDLFGGFREFRDKTLRSFHFVVEPSTKTRSGMLEVGDLGQEFGFRYVEVADWFQRMSP